MNIFCHLNFSNMIWFLIVFYCNRGWKKFRNIYCEYLRPQALFKHNFSNFFLWSINIFCHLNCYGLQHHLATTNLQLPLANIFPGHCLQSFHVFWCFFMVFMVFMVFMLLMLLCFWCFWCFWCSPLPRSLPAVSWYFLAAPSQTGQLPHFWLPNLSIEVLGYSEKGDTYHLYHRNLRVS